mmetsp:Transcript_63904/g.132423  ORF Transcript_63904/g.132423 Transcript_63904/m.132423 type:complete len:109 (-) Transcript_63904:3-329(-)
MLPWDEVVHAMGITEANEPDVVFSFLLAPRIRYHSSTRRRPGEAVHQHEVLDTEVTFRAIVVKFNVPRPIFIVQSENSKSPPMLEDSRSDLHGALSMHQPQAAKSEPT